MTLHNPELTNATITALISAFYYADRVLENDHIFLSDGEQNDDVIKAKIRLWRNVIDLCGESESLLKSVLLKTNIKTWILAVLRDSRSLYFDAGLELANEIIYAEDVHENLLEEVAGQVKSTSRTNVSLLIKHD
jgi:hypothetical protein